MAATTKEIDNATKNTRRVTVRLPRLSGQNADQTEFYAVNGRTCRVKRGETVEIREEIAEVIRNNEQAEDYAMNYIDNLKKKGNPDTDKALN
jgi:hypothetical protein